MIIKLVSNIDRNCSRIQLTINGEYEVLGIENNYYRIIPQKYDSDLKLGLYLYDNKCFEIIDNVEPSFWINNFED